MKDKFMEGAKVGMAMQNLATEIEKLPETMTREFLVDWYLENANTEILQKMATGTLIKLATGYCGKTIQRSL